MRKAPNADSHYGHSCFNRWMGSKRFMDADFITQILLTWRGVCGKNGYPM